MHPKVVYFITDHTSIKGLSHININTNFIPNLSEQDLVNSTTTIYNLLIMFYLFACIL